MAGLTTGRILGTSLVVKVQHDEDPHYPQAEPHLEIYLVVIEINLCVLSCVSFISLICKFVFKVSRNQLFRKKGSITTKTHKER